MPITVRLLKLPPYRCTNNVYYDEISCKPSSKIGGVSTLYCIQVQVWCFRVPLETGTHA